jgi:hypothetical protein
MSGPVTYTKCVNIDLITVGPVAFRVLSAKMAALSFNQTVTAAKRQTARVPLTLRYRHHLRVFSYTSFVKIDTVWRASLNNTLG